MSAPQRYVYFARRKDGVGPIKIGISRMPEERVYRISSHLEVVVSIPGDGLLERKFHTLLRSWHVGGEWFEPSPFVLWVMSEVQSGTFNFAFLPERLVVITANEADLRKTIHKPVIRPVVKRSLLQYVEDFLESHQIRPCTFGGLALDDKHFVRQLRRGRRVWPETEAKVRAFMQSYNEQQAA